MTKTEAKQRVLDAIEDLTKVELPAGESFIVFLDEVSGAVLAASAKLYKQEVDSIIKKVPAAKSLDELVDVLRGQHDTSARLGADPSGQNERAAERSEGCGGCENGACPACVDFQRPSVRATHKE